MVRGALAHARSRELSDDRLSRTFAALADPTRRAAIELLRRGPQRAGELADALGSTPAGLSRHLRVLRESGLVLEEVPEGDARVRIYHLAREPFGELRTWVEDVEAFWGEQLAAFKAYAERTRGGAAKRVAGERTSRKAGEGRVAMRVAGASAKRGRR
ncbi:MAG TPA: metalloregulator ArsR/SmtB family transcription factor [Polyangiaceae bacterium]|nr:metalloregulator ArsR/SmtB family transcription factor [Polyangiaceae bacterium]